MSFYEHTLVAKQDLSSSEIDKVQSKYSDIINGTSGKVVKIEGNNKTVDEIKKNIIIDSSVLRHLIIKYKKLDLKTEYFKKDERENEKKK